MPPIAHTHLSKGISFENHCIRSIYVPPLLIAWLWTKNGLTPTYQKPYNIFYMKKRWSTSSNHIWAFALPKMGGKWWKKTFVFLWTSCTFWCWIGSVGKTVVFPYIKCKNQGFSSNNCVSYSQIWGTQSCLVSFFPVRNGVPFPILFLDDLV